MTAEELDFYVFMSNFDWASASVLASFDPHRPFCIGFEAFAVEEVPPSFFGRQ
jgi:hypothetical protein